MSRTTSDAADREDIAAAAPAQGAKAPLRYSLERLQDRVRRILQDKLSTNLRAVKQLGREVRGFNEETWVRHRVEIVTKGNLAKFGQNPVLAGALLSTGKSVLVEASPTDRVWGIGMRASDPDSRDPMRWRGLNLLGFVLMSVRASLRVEALNKASKKEPEPRGYDFFDDVTGDDYKGGA